MPKKSDKNTDSKIKSRPKKNSELEDAILKNLIELQKVHTNLAEKFDKLAKEISELLSLFEMTAKSFVKHSPIGEFEKDKEFLEKIDRLLDQNKTIAKGLGLMEERLRERVYGSVQQKNEETLSAQAQKNRPLPRF